MTYHLPNAKRMYTTLAGFMSELAAAEPTFNVFNYDAV